MIDRNCNLAECRAPFSVRFKSDPKAYCGGRCAGIAIQRARAAGAAAADGARGAEKVEAQRQGRVLRFIDGMEPLDVFQAAVRMGYERRQLETDGAQLGELGRLTRQALAGL